MNRTMPFDQPAIPEPAPGVRLLFDRANHRLQMTTGQFELVRWDGDCWLYTPFLHNDDDFLLMARFLAEIAGAPMEIETMTTFGPVVRYRSWPTTVLAPKTAIVYDQASSEVEVHPPDPTDGSQPRRHYTFFLRTLRDFHAWSITLSKIAGKELRPIPEHGPSQADRSTRMFCFV